ncbi:MAG: 4-hydroxy-3-methylbut-2-enyl diphosphate reductase [Gammaproteobacteria bacterium]|nr:4-hydroxy-3-methylbut-2-enyl diphosphate reductase [Gammaproteobacteria bacterium]
MSPSTNPKRLIIASPRGFCAGVDRAITIVEKVLERLGAPIYVRHEVVHNRFVVEGLRQRGAIFVDDLNAIPDAATVIFSAHGVSSAVEKIAQERRLQIFDATCPLVTKVHLEVIRHARSGDNVILIGHAGHPEVEGTMGRFEPEFGGHIYLVERVADVAALHLSNDRPLAFVTQTTLSVDDSRAIIAALRQRFPDIAAQRKDDICYATQSRQDAIKKLASAAQTIFIVGSANSSNSNRLREVAERSGCRAYLIDSYHDISPAMWQGSYTIGLSAGASAPETLVSEVVSHFTGHGYQLNADHNATREEVFFALPKSLTELSSPPQPPKVA